PGRLSIHPQQRSPLPGTEHSPLFLGAVGDLHASDAVYGPSAPPRCAPDDGLGIRHPVDGHVRHRHLLSTARAMMGRPLRPRVVSTTVTMSRPRVWALQRPLPWRIAQCKKKAKNAATVPGWP